MSAAQAQPGGGDRPERGGPRRVGGTGAPSRAPAGQPAGRTVFPAARSLRLLVYAGLAVLGVLTGAAGALFQAAWFPLGLLLGLAAAVGLFHGGATLCRTKAGAGVPGAAWTLTVLAMTTTRPEGDFVFAAGIASYIYLFGGILAAVMCTTLALPAPPVAADRRR